MMRTDEVTVCFFSQPDLCFVLFGGLSFVMSHFLCFAAFVPSNMCAMLSLLCLMCIVRQLKRFETSNQRKQLAQDTSGGVVQSAQGDRVR